MYQRTNLYCGIKPETDKLAASPPDHEISVKRPQRLGSVRLALGDQSPILGRKAALLEITVSGGHGGCG
jgi:hypothetical protein